MMACETPSTGPAVDILARLAAQIPVLRTERLVLRAPQVGDFATYAQIVTSERGSFIGITSREDAWYDFNQMVAGWMLRGHGVWSVATQDEELLGFVLLGFDPEDPEPELGYIFTEAAEGRGYATEAAIAARDFAYEALGWSTLVSFIDPQNTRSIAVAERLGARLDGQIEDPDKGDITLIYRHPTQPNTQPERPTQSRRDTDATPTLVSPVSEDQNV